jgi:UV DNA damage endonuclease
VNNIGYACINMDLSEQPKSKRVTTNRSMIKRTFQEKGVAYASELALANCRV